MSDKPNDGGPAFPVVIETRPHDSLNIGMSLRDYFAAAALNGWRSEGACDSNGYGSSPYWSSPRMAQVAYQDADAMLKAREEIGK